MQPDFPHRSYVLKARESANTHFLPLMTLVLISVYVKGGLGLLGLGQTGIRIVTELPVILLGLQIILSKTKHVAPGLRWIALLFLWSLLGVLVRSDSLWDTWLYLRWPIYGYIVFCAAWNTQANENQIHRLISLIIIIWVGQIVFSVIKVIVFGSRVEAIVGTISCTGGAVATVFPLLVLCYCMAFFYYRARRPILWLLLGLVSGIVGYASGKRGIYYYIPICYFSILAYQLLRLRSQPKSRFVLKQSLLLLLVLPAFLYGMANSNMISAYGVLADEGDSIAWKNINITEQIKWSVSAAINSETSTYDDQGRVGSRTGASHRMLERLLQMPLSEVLFGIGFSSFIGERSFTDIFEIYYGISGWIEDVASTGIVGLFCQLGFFLSVWRTCFRNKVPPNWRVGVILREGTLSAILVFFFIYFTYLSAIGMAGWYTWVVFVFAGLVSGESGRQFQVTDPKPHRQ